MSFTVAEVITEVRDLVSDSMAPYRYSDDFLVRKVNQAVRRACVLRPDLFTTHASITLAIGALQSAPADSMRLMDVTTIGGIATKEISQDTLDLMFPSWPSDATATSTASNWMRYPRDPNRFYVYPAPVALGASATIVYAKSPATLAIDGAVPLPDAFMPCIIDGTGWLVEAVDAEYSETSRAKAFETSFREALTTGISGRPLTDTESGGSQQERSK